MGRKEFPTIKTKEDIKKLEGLSFPVFAWVNPRVVTVTPDFQRIYLDQEEFKELGESIERTGVQQPPTLNFLKGELVVVDGTQRLKHAEAKGISQVLCKIIKVDVLTHAFLSIELNRHVKENPLDLAKRVAWIKRHGKFTMEEIGRRLEKSKGWVSTMLQIDELSNGLKRLFSTLNFSFYDYQKVLPMLRGMSYEEAEKLLVSCKTKQELFSILNNLKGQTELKTGEATTTQPEARKDGKDVQCTEQVNWAKVEAKKAEEEAREPETVEEAKAQGRMVPLEPDEAKLRPERCFICGDWAKPPAKTIIVVHKACREKLRELIEAGKINIEKGES